MQRADGAQDRALVVQLARLGDVVQSLPAIEALRQSRSGIMDAICAEPLVPVLRACASLGRALPWSGSHWSGLASMWADHAGEVLSSMRAWFENVPGRPYETVYNLNQHARSILLSHLLGGKVCGPGADGPLASGLSPWGAYLRTVACDRAANRIHLADAWCGMCGVKPLGRGPRLRLSVEELPGDLAAIGSDNGMWVAIVIGAGETARWVPPAAWASWVTLFLSRVSEGRVILVGSAEEREAGHSIHEALPPLLHARVWNAAGRTTLSQLMHLFARCRWVLGSDTGPLHLATSVGAQAMGFYFARARVHETGPYGEGHRVFQHATEEPPARWPWAESVAALLGTGASPAKGWTLWESRVDHWGACYVSEEQDHRAIGMREFVWRTLSPHLTESIAA
jgi:ADP-heptose:LPS heptosyltransferase